MAGPDHVGDRLRRRGRYARQSAKTHDGWAVQQRDRARPTLADEEQATPELQERVRFQYGLDHLTSSTAAEGRAAPGGTYGTYYGGPLEGKETPESGGP